MGGFDEQGNPVNVEIDESKFFHRKYHRGAYREGHWVFGAIERRSRKCFVVEVPDRRKRTLEAIISRELLPGTRIISEGWASYADIDQLANGVYAHDVVVHENYFVDPDYPDIHTQNVENMWARLKRKFKRQYGTSSELFPTYLKEFMFRQRFTNKEMCRAFIQAVASIYVV